MAKSRSHKEETTAARLRKEVPHDASVKRSSEERKKLREKQKRLKDEREKRKRSRPTKGLAKLVTGA